MFIIIFSSFVLVMMLSCLKALRKLDEIDRQLASTDLPRNSSALAELHSYLSNLIMVTTAPALHEGRTILERVGKDDPGAQGVSAMVRFITKIVFFVFMNLLHNLFLLRTRL